MHTTKRTIEIVLATPRGFCAGVKRAIDIVEECLRKFGPPVYVRHEIVHNRYVIEDLSSRGVIFVNETDEIPEGAVAIFSAHGVSDRVEEEAQARELRVVDATCPLVKKVHTEARRYEGQDMQIIMIGHKGHAEVEGTTGKVKQEVLLVSSEEDVDALNVEDSTKLAYITQTTLSVDDTVGIIARLKHRFPMIQGPNTRDICYATQNRQEAVKKLAKETDVILVIGSKNSSNSNRLCEVALGMGKESYLIDNAGDISLEWFDGKRRVGITAGASAPEALIDGVVAFLSESFNASVTTMDGVEERVRFSMPVI